MFHIRSSATWRLVTVLCACSVKVWDIRNATPYCLDDTVTLHWNYLEWPKYKTAKPLLYKVYRTRNRKRLRSKWSGKEVSFEAVRKTRKRLAEVTSGGRLHQRRLPMCLHRISHLIQHLQSGPKSKLECFSLSKSDLKSLDFAVTRFLMKLSRMSTTDIIAECQHYFGFSLPSKLIERKKK